MHLAERGSGTVEEELEPYKGPPNLHLLEELYDRWKKDRDSVDSSWAHFFEGMEFGLSEVQGSIAQAPGDLRVHSLIYAYRTYGHLLAKFNPIDVHPIDEVPQLRLETLGFREGELATPFPTCGFLEVPEAPLSEIINALREIYCGRIGVEYMGLQRPALESWLQEKVEPSRFAPPFSIEQKKEILHDLNRAELFELFLHTKYVGQKRFSLEGSETLIPILQALIRGGAEEEIEEFVIAMAHRGRLNVLCNILNKAYANIFHEFEDSLIQESFEGSGDVKYHKGYAADVETPNGRKVRLNLAANPSHLEAVDPVVEGLCRAKQVRKGDAETMKRIAPILIHGDAALAGQGVVYETMQMSRLPGYGVGGTIHVVINNQIGFTTLPQDSRSTRYCTEIARAFSAPVFHVNAEDPEGCVWAALLAIQLRQKFGCDVFIDLNCYRKYGHNESDEPAFTQPLEYQLIRKKNSPREIYRDVLIQRGVIEQKIAEELEAQFKAELQKELEDVQNLKTQPFKEHFDPEWEGAMRANWEADLFADVDTKVSVERLRALTKKFTAIPEGFALHRKVEKVTKDRLAIVMGELDVAHIDWGLGEHLAFATLLEEGHHVRLSGQDSRRGTFSHRHAMWRDQISDRKYFPLNHLGARQGRFDVFNSPLSEYGVLGFEFGYSLDYYDALVIWEAQYGDFCNGAQIAIDQFISASEQKWHRLSGLTLLLPHGYEGQGPEHSSARMERFLQLAAEGNLRICNVSTPAQLFHLLRRQVLLPSRKPLILFSPKQLLRHPHCVSSLRDFSEGAFQEMLDDLTPPAVTRKLVFCTGRLYYDLIEERQKRNNQEVAIVRIEQLYPFNDKKLQELLKKYSGYEQLLWVQEEPQNMGAWEFIRPLLGNDAHYVGRARSASPATGSPKKHKAQLEALMDGVFGT
ncbi:MAG: 2-oxoglutarate dehydrogenase E1 component [Verrucomicrobia bacterium]|nr:2-oxoglutarate dehydrogenase E1 component [Verrucomicrobiota bacterium]